MQMDERDKDPMLQEPRHGGQILGDAKVLLRWFLNVLRLATGPSEVASLLRYLFKFLKWRLTGSSDAEGDETLRLQGVRHFLGIGSGEFLTLQQIYSERQYEWLQEFVPQPGWIVFDVGANSGVYAVKQARRGAYVYAFEPNPDCYRRLQKSVRANKLESRVMAVNYALGATAGSAELFLPAGVTVLGSLRPGGTPEAGAIGLKVEVETVDRVVRKLGINRINLLKVDVEGLELDVLKGAQESFELVDHLVIEHHSLDLRRRVVELLAGRGLSIVHDEKTRTVCRGFLYAKRQAGNITGRSEPLGAVT